MNQAVDQALGLIEGLVEAGVKWLVCSPGSRDAPLVLAAAGAERDGLIKTWVRVDERTAGFGAVGLAMAGAGPVALVCTSGTAAANYHPAVLEAAHSRLPLVVITADRPAELQRVGANQTTDQAGLYARAVAASWQLQADQPAAQWRQAANQATKAARGWLSLQPGPVHVNAALRAPLVPNAQSSGTLSSLAPEPASGLTGQEGAERSPGLHQGTCQLRPVELDRGPNTLVVAGAGSGPAARALAEAAGWPLLAEPESGSWGGANAVTAGRLLVSQPALANRIERVVVYGRPVLTRPITTLVQRPDLLVVGVHATGGQWFDQGHAAQRLASAVSVSSEPTLAEAAWLETWQAAGQVAWQAMVAHLSGRGLTGPTVAAAVGRACAGQPLVVGASNALRDLDLTPATGGPVYAARGLAGIDGTVSLATGLALGLGQPVTVLLGDLALLHDAGGLASGVHEPGANLRVVVLNDQGGGIFEGLEVGQAHLRPAFERYFAAPQAVNLAALAQAFGLEHRAIDGLAALSEALAGPWQGRQLIEVGLDRAVRAGLEAELMALVQDQMC